MFESREVRAAAAGAAVVALYTALVLGSGRVDPQDFARLLVLYLGGSFALWLMVGVVAFLVILTVGARRSGDEPFLLNKVRELILGGWTAERLAVLLWPPLLFGTLMASFNAFKQMILPAVGFGLDPFLASLDRALFLGVDPWRVTHALFGSARATALIDHAYHGWFLPMSLGLILCAWLPASTFRLRTQYVLSYIGVWVGIGSVLPLLLPSAGPCFYAHFAGSSPSFDLLMSRLAHAEAETGAPLIALRNQAMLLEAFGSDTLRVGGGISAMPSVHNALAALFALAAFRLSRTAGLLLSLYAGVIWIGSIHLGWHYAVDGIAAIGLTLLIWRVAGRIAEVIDRPIQLPADQPALA